MKVTGKWVLLAGLAALSETHLTEGNLKDVGNLIAFTLICLTYAVTGVKSLFSSPGDFVEAAASPLLAFLSSLH